MKVVIKEVWYGKFRVAIPGRPAFYMKAKIGTLTRMLKASGYSVRVEGFGSKRK